MGCGAVGCAGWPNEGSCPLTKMTRQKYCLGSDGQTRCECRFRCVDAPRKCLTITALLAKYATNDPQADVNDDNFVNGVDFGMAVRL